MKGTLTALAILGAILAAMFFAYKKVNGSNLFKDLWRDIKRGWF